MNKKIITFSLLLCTLISAKAQETTQDSILKRQITVEHVVKPKINDAGKVLTNPAMVKSDIKKERPAYSIQQLPFTSFKKEVNRYVAQTLSHTPSLVKTGLVRVGVGVPMMTLADVLYPVYNDNYNRLDFNLGHLGAFGKKTDSETNVALKYDHLFEKFIFHSGIELRNGYFNYYGDNFGKSERVYLSNETSKPKYQYLAYTNIHKGVETLETLSKYPQWNNLWDIALSMGVNSHTTNDGFSYQSNLKYHQFKENINQISEHRWSVSANFAMPFDADRLGLNLSVDNFNYNSTTSDFTLSGGGYTIIILNPYYQISTDEWSIRLGAKSGISINYGQIFTPTPDIAFEWNVAPETVSLYGNIGGDIKINSLSNIYGENRYLSSETRLKDTWTPVDTRIGITAKPTYNLLLDLFGRYQYIVGNYFFVNKPYSLKSSSTGVEENLTKIYQNRFVPVYSDAQKATLGFRANFNHKDQINLYFKGLYNHWQVKTEDYAWHKPTWEVNFGANLKLDNNISVATQFILEDGRYAQLNTPIAMNAVFDWNINGSYVYKDWISFFVQINNILNQKYDYYNGYEAFGFNVMGGVAISF